MMRVRKAKHGFTLMELMIALGLLGALMIVAWSLLGTFRDAEMRGWKLAHRTQTIRSARAWLENDMQHLIVDATLRQPVLPLGSNSKKQSGAAVFHGNAMGFTAVLSPSVDPIPFLGSLMSDGSEPSSLDAREELGVDEGLGDASLPASPWPADSVEVQYELRPMVTSRSASSKILDSVLDSTQYSLVRREKMDSLGRTALAPPSERVLSGKDLYRLEDQAIVSSAVATSESKLDGLMRPQFRYFDGVAWVAQWDSIQRGGLPRAIAIGFDFPPSTDIVHPSEREFDERPEVDPSRVDEFTALSQFNPAEQEQESSLERGGDKQGIMISSTNEVQMVILIAGGVPSNATESNQPSPSRRQ